MKYIVLVLALVALVSLVSANKIRLQLEEVQASQSNLDTADEFFQLKKRKVFIHDNKETEGLFVTTLTLAGKSRKMILNTGSDKSWFADNESPEEFVKKCTARKTCSVPDEPSVTTYTALIYINGGITVDQSKLVSEQVKFSNKGKELTLNNLWIDYLDTKQVHPKDFLKNLGVDGAMSMARGSYKGFIQRLQDNKYITNKVFAFFFAQDETKDKLHNFVTLGGYEQYLCTDDISKGKQSFKTLDGSKNQKEYWLLQMRDSTIGTSKDHTDLTSFEALFDTAIQGYFTPLSYVENLLQTKEFKACTLSHGGVVSCTCKVSDLPDLKLRFKGQEQYYTLKPEMYAKQDKDGKTLKLQFQAINGKQFVLGRNFMSHYYTIFDMENKAISITPVYIKSPDTWVMNETSRWLIIGFGVFFFFLTFCALIKILQPIQTVKGKGPKNVVHNDHVKQSARPQHLANQSEHSAKVQNSAKVQHLEKAEHSSNQIEHQPDHSTKQQSVSYVQQPQYVYVQQPQLQTSVVRAQSPMQYVQTNPLQGSVIVQQQPLVQPNLVMQSPSNVILQQSQMSPPRYR